VREWVGMGQAQPTHLYRAASAFAFQRSPKPQNFPFNFFKIPRARFFLKGAGKFFGFGNQPQAGAEAGEA